MRTAQIKRGVRDKFISETRILKIVVIKLILPRILDIPAKCKEKIAKSTLLPGCPKFLERGGYTVHPVPAPLSAIEDIIKRKIDGGSNQKDRLFSRGKAMSTQPNIKGSNQFPNPPIIIGITIKKIIKKACAVTNTL